MPDATGADGEVSQKGCELVDGTLLSNCKFSGNGALAELCDLEFGTCIQAERMCDNGWCLIPAATFATGSPHTNAARWNELPPNTITLTRSFLIQETEVTLADWLRVMGGENPSRYEYAPEYPVTGIGFYDAIAFANSLSDLERRQRCYVLIGCDGDPAVGRECETVEFAGPSCEGYRLPSEAEWELAAGLGLRQCHPDYPNSPQDSFHFDGSCGFVADQGFPLRYCMNSSVEYEGCIDLTGIGGPVCAGPGPVREFPPNGFGLYGMGGNVHEFTGSRFRWPLVLPPPRLELGYEVDPGFDARPIDGSEVDPDGLIQAVAVRGGGFNQSVMFTCVYSRGPLLPTKGASEFVGFRLVRTRSD